MQGLRRRASPSARSVSRPAGPERSPPRPLRRDAGLATLNDAVAAVPTLPSLSIARTSTECEPAARPVNCSGCRTRWTPPSRRQLEARAVRVRAAEAPVAVVPCHLSTVDVARSDLVGHWSIDTLSSVGVASSRVSLYWMYCRARRRARPLEGRPATSGVAVCLYASVAAPAPLGVAVSRRASASRAIEAAGAGEGARPSQSTLIAPAAHGEVARDRPHRARRWP